MGRQIVEEGIGVALAFGPVPRNPLPALFGSL
jgi:hypothetical protein